MFVLASHFGPSEKAIWVAVLVIVTPAAFVGFFAGSPLRGFKLGGLTSGGLTFLWLASGTGQAIVFAAIFTPIFAIIGGLVGCFFGWIGGLSLGPKAPRSRVGDRNAFKASDGSGEFNAGCLTAAIPDRNPFEPGDGSDGEQRQDHQPDNAQRVPEL